MLIYYCFFCFFLRFRIDSQVIFQSDAGCAAAILRGALEAASLNVLVNTKTMTDRAAAQRLNERCFALLERGAEGERIFRAVRERLT